MWVKVEQEVAALDEQNLEHPSAAVPAEALSAEDQALLDKYEKTFIGEFSHSLDSKGRIIVPLSFREGLGKTFCIGPTFNFQAIALYPTLVWARLRDGYAKLSRFDSKLKRYLEQFDALCYRGQECDSQGRVLLPARIRQRILGDEKDVEIAGNDDHVRIVARPACDEQFNRFMDELSDVLEHIDQLAQNSAQGS